MTDQNETVEWTIVEVADTLRDYLRVSPPPPPAESPLIFGDNPIADLASFSSAQAFHLSFDLATFPVVDDAGPIDIKPPKERRLSDTWHCPLTIGSNVDRQSPPCSPAPDPPPPECHHTDPSQQRAESHSASSHDNDPSTREVPVAVDKNSRYEYLPRAHAESTRYPLTTPIHAVMPPSDVLDAAAAQRPDPTQHVNDGAHRDQHEGGVALSMRLPARNRPRSHQPHSEEERDRASAPLAIPSPLATPLYSPDYQVPYFPSGVGDSPSSELKFYTALLLPSPPLTPTLSPSSQSKANDEVYHDITALPPPPLVFRTLSETPSSSSETTGQVAHWFAESTSPHREAPDQDQHAVSPSAEERASHTPAVFDTSSGNDPSFQLPDVANTDSNSFITRHTSKQAPKWAGRFVVDTGGSLTVHLGFATAAENEAEEDEKQADVDSDRKDGVRGSKTSPTPRQATASSGIHKNRKKKNKKEAYTRRSHQSPASHQQRPAVYPSSAPVSLQRPGVLASGEVANESEDKEPDGSSVDHNSRGQHPRSHNPDLFQSPRNVRVKCTSDILFYDRAWLELTFTGPLPRQAVGQSRQELARVDDELRVYAIQMECIAGRDLADLCDDLDRDTGGTRETQALNMLTAALKSDGVCHVLPLPSGCEWNRTQHRLVYRCQEDLPITLLFQPRLWQALEPKSWNFLREVELKVVLKASGPQRSLTAEWKIQFTLVKPRSVELKRLIRKCEAREDGKKASWQPQKAGEASEKAEKSRRRVATSAPTRSPANALPLPLEVVDAFDGLHHSPRRLNVLGDGRCSVASVLLALEIIADDHNDSKSRALIDDHRCRLGRTIGGPKWTEHTWLREVPNDLRSAHTRRIPRQDVIKRTSFQVYRDLLTDPKSATQWLDHCVFYLASAQYEVGIFILTIVQHSRGPHVMCRHIPHDANLYIVLVHTVRGRYGHYECVEYDKHRVFPSNHEFVERLASLSVQHPPLATKEHDQECSDFIQRSQARSAPAESGRVPSA